MTPADDAELRRLTEMLHQIDGMLPEKSPQIEALKKAALALSTVFLEGRRSEIEDLYENLGGDLTEQQKNRLHSMGINPEGRNLS